MNVLFIHQNFPGPFRQLSAALIEAGHLVVALTIAAPAEAQDPRMRVVRYQPARATSREIQPWVAEFETKVIRGEACAKAMLQLRESGFTPEVVIAHPGWGESLFVKDVFPSVKLINLLEFHYASKQRDLDFDAELQHPSFEDSARVRLKNANGMLALDAMDWGMTPTRWQKEALPIPYRARTSVIHEGIDTNLFTPAADATIKLDPVGRVVRAGDEVITFVTRHLDPYRGFHIFMRALPNVLRRRPNAVALIIGDDAPGYLPPIDGHPWRERMMAEVKSGLDLSRVFFLGRLPQSALVPILQVSRVHVGFSFPFVPSVSLLEAMSAGAVVVGSKTPPVEEVITHSKTGFLVDFFDVARLARTLTAALDMGSRLDPMRCAARQLVVERFDAKTVCVPRQLALIQTLTSMPSVTKASALQKGGANRAA